MLKLLLSAAVLAAILVRPQDAVNGAQQAMRVWYSSVAPALFPFLVLMPALTGREACRMYNRLLSPIMQRLFRLPGAAAPAVVISMVSGSPGGAIAISRVAGGGGIERSDARRMALALTGLSPAYLVIGVGCGICGSPAIGWKLAGLQCAIQLGMLFFLRNGQRSGNEICEEEAAVEASGMGAAVETVLGVCGYMVVFGAAASVAAGFLGNKAGAALLLALDLPGGLALLKEMHLPGSGVLGCAAIGFGGICIAAQNMDALRKIGVRWREYLSARVFVSLLFACVGGILLRGELPDRISVVNFAPAYAFSLIFSCVIAIPGIIFLSKNLFLNKGKSEK